MPDLPHPERPSRRASAGFSLLEVIICTGVLAIAVAALVSAILTSSHLNTRVSCESTALASAAYQLDLIRATPFPDIVNNLIVDRSTSQFRPRATFVVPGLPLPNGSDHNGEILFITSEMPAEAGYGVDLDGDGTVSTSALAGGFGVDINGDGSTTTADYKLDWLTGTYMSTPSLIPVVVVVNWRMSQGLQTMQLRTVIVNRCQ